MATLMSFKQFKQLFPDENAVIKHYIEIRYKHKVKCHHCGSEKVYQYKKRPKFFQCNDCHNTFSIFKGTIFENTKADLVDWYYVIHLLMNGKKGVSSYHIQRMIGGGHEKSWHMLKQIRIGFRNQEVFTDFKGVYEADEVYCNGGLRKHNIMDIERYHKAVIAPDDEKIKEILNELEAKAKKHYKKRKTKTGKRGRGTDKVAVLGIINRDTKQVYAKVMPHNEVGKRFTAEQVNKEFKTAMQGANPTVITDDFEGYDKIHELGIKRIIIVHKIAFAKKGVHTNTIECFWSNIQRMIMGSYHHVSKELIQSYIDECVFRFNNRDGKIFFKYEIFEKFLGETILV